MSELSLDSTAKSTEVASADDFRRLAFARADDEFGEPERIVLPGSGLAVMVRRPSALYFSLRGLPLPQSVAAKASEGKSSQMTEESLRELAARVVGLFSRAFVSPRLSLNPAADEISPNWLLPDDVAFILKFLMGEVLAGGQDLASFRSAAGASASAGASGETPALPAERAS